MLVELSFLRTWGQGGLGFRVEYDFRARGC